LVWKRKDLKFFKKINSKKKRVCRGRGYRDVDRLKLHRGGRTADSRLHQVGVIVGGKRDRLRKTSSKKKWRQFEKTNSGLKSLLFTASIWALLFCPF